MGESMQNHNENHAILMERYALVMERIYEIPKEKGCTLSLDVSIC